MKSLLLHIINDLRPRNPSLALVLQEITLMPISWRTQIINMCQTGVRDIPVLLLTQYQ